MSSDPLFVAAEAYARGRNYSNLFQINPLMFATSYIEHTLKEPPDNWRGIKEFFNSFILANLVETED